MKGRFIMNKTITMHKIVNVCFDTECNEVGFELDNKAVIYQYDGVWSESMTSRFTYYPIVDDEDNLQGFYKQEVKEIIVDFIEPDEDFII